MTDGQLVAHLVDTLHLILKECQEATAQTDTEGELGYLRDSIDEIHKLTDTKLRQLRKAAGRSLSPETTG